MLKRKGFTLLELLIVIAIIAILAGILIPTLRAAQRRARIAATETMISSLRLAISMYETDMGGLPPLTHPELHEWLIDPGDPGSNDDPPGWHGPYMEFRAEDVQPFMGGQEIIDFWGEEFELTTTRPTGAPAGHSVYIWSLGPDGEDDGVGTPPSGADDDDITSW